MRHQPSALALVLLLAPPSLAQAPESLGWDPAIRRGALDNGLSYFVERLPNPPGKLEVRLVLAAGSSREREDERGLAHFCTHMAFKGSEHFAPGEIEDHFNELGVPMEQDFNGMTLEACVVFSFAHPSATVAEVDRALDVLTDFAGGATLGDREIEGERAVIVAEKRSALATGQQRGDPAESEELAGTLFADRDPLGSMKVIAGAPASAIRSFYRKWYRPDLMTVVVTGDIDPDSVAAALAGRLGVRRAPAAPVPQAALVFPADRRFVAVPGGNRSPTACLTLVRAADVGGDRMTAEQARRNVAAQMGALALAGRLRALPLLPGSPILGASIDTEEETQLTRGVVTWTLVATAHPNRVLDAAVLLGATLETVRVEAFTQADVDSAKDEVGTWLECFGSSALARTSAEEADTIVDALLDHEPKPASQDLIALERSLLATMTPAHLSAAWRDLLEHSRLVVDVRCPDGEPCPDREQLRTAWATIKPDVPATAPAEVTKPPESLLHPPTPAAIGP